MKKIVSILALGALALGLLSGCGSKTDGEAVSVQSVGLITGVGAVGIADSYAGKVVSGETAEIKRDADKTVLEVLVEEGDMVSAGDVLFTYDTEAMQLSLDKLYLDRESYENTIAASENEIAELEKERAKASSGQQLSYTLQIDSREADIREAQYNMALKDKEIEAMEASMEKTEIPSPISGRVMSVGSTDDSADYGGEMGGMDGMGGMTNSDAFITVMDVSSYRVEGHINELNRGAITEGMPVIVRSRTDEEQIFTGVIEKIDWEKPVSNTNNGGMMDMSVGDEMTSSSQYPFYVALDDTGDLLLGQHVYIEPDLGQGDDVPALMLPSWFVVDDSFVWAAGANGRLEKRSVTLGDYNAETDEVEILSGLDYTDYIAFPDDTLSAGMEVVYYDESSFGGDEMYFDEGMYGEDGMYAEDGMYFEDGASEELPAEDGIFPEEAYEELPAGEDLLPEDAEG